MYVYTQIYTLTCVQISRITAFAIKLFTGGGGGGCGGGGRYKLSRNDDGKNKQNT